MPRRPVERAIIAGPVSTEPWGAGRRQEMEVLCRNSHRQRGVVSGGSGSRCESHQEAPGPALQAVGACWGGSLTTPVPCLTRGTTQGTTAGSRSSRCSRSTLTCACALWAVTFTRWRAAPPQRSDCRGMLRPATNSWAYVAPLKREARKPPRDPSQVHTVEAGPGPGPEPLPPRAVLLSLSGGSQRHWERPFPSYTPFWVSSP